MMTETIQTLEDMIMRDLERGAKSWSIKSHGFANEEEIRITREDKEDENGK